MSDINLLENQLKSDSGFRSKNYVYLIRKFLTTLFILSLLLAGGLYFYGYLIERRPYSELSAAEYAQIEELDNKLLEAAALHKSLAYSQIVVDEHLYWTNLFKLINSAAITGVRFQNFAATNAGNIELSVSAVDFNTMAAFVKKLNDLEGINHTSVISSALSDAAGDHLYRFVLNIRFNPAILQPHNLNAN